MQHQVESLTNNQKTILVVDDDPVTLEFVSEMLLGDNYSVLTASGGESAVRLARDYKSKIYLLLSDFSMTGMTGIDSAAKLTLEQQQLKVLIMSAYDADMLVLNKRWRVLPKPFTCSQLRTLVAGLVFSDKELEEITPQVPGIPDLSVPSREGEPERRTTQRTESTWISTY
jgi:CheY-like chemotaxis protein